MTEEQLRIRAREVADELMGTCKSLEEVTTEEERNSRIFCAELDDQVMLCDTCGWWCETSEINDDGECDDCAGEH